VTDLQHNRTWAIVLDDDGTLDTVVRCDACNEEFRYTYEGGPDEQAYDDFVAWALDDAAQEHEAAL